MSSRPPPPPPDRFDEIARQLSTLTMELAEVRQRLDDPLRSTATSRPTADSANKPRLKLDVPRFNGSDTHGWIFKITQFFTYHQTPEEERITIASFYLDGPAIAWYQWMYQNHQIVSWAQFLTALETRFAPTAFDDPRGNLFKLTQTSTVAAYLTEFEALANRLEGLSDQILLSCFISGIKIDIRREVLTQQPATISQAAGLARLQEDKIHDVARSARPRPSQPWQPAAAPRPPFKDVADTSVVKPSSGLLPTPAAKP